MSRKGNKQILLCVDDFTSYVVCIPLKNTTAETILEGMKDKLFNQFGIPKIIRSDEQASFYNSNLFYETLTNMGIELTATAVASPFSNARAESQIKNIKHLTRKFLFQEGISDNWDDYLQILTNSHNKSTGIYGYSSEELMFGNKIPSRIDILNFNSPNFNMQGYIDHVMPIAEEMRREARKRMDQKAEKNRTFKNKNKRLKKFDIGDMVVHKQLQVSTGMNSKYRPLYTGPYTIVQLNKDGSTAILEHMKTGRMIKGHFTNMQYLYYAPELNRINEEKLKKLTDDMGTEYIVGTKDTISDQVPETTTPPVRYHNRRIHTQ
jgi:ribosomal protein L21E